MVKGNRTNTYSFFSRFLLLNHLKAKLLLPIMQIGIVAYVFTLSWDNLCRNSCIKKADYNAFRFCRAFTLIYPKNSLSWEFSISIKNQYC